MLRIGVVTAFPQEDWHSARLIHEVGARGAEPVVLDPSAFALGTGPRSLTVSAEGRPVLALDALLLARGLSPDGDGEVQLETYRQLDALGQPQVNRVDALLSAQDKVRTSCLFARARVPTPETLVVQSVAGALAALAHLGRAVIKPRFGSLGEGMVRLRDDGRGRGQVRALLEREGSLYLQRYVETGGVDYRVFVVGGRARGAVRRTARRNEWRTNASLGGRVEPFQAASALTRMACAAARAVGLDYTAVDLVEGPRGPLVLEVNGHPNFELVWRSSRVDIAVPVVELVLRRARASANPFRTERSGRADPRSLRERSDGGWTVLTPSA